MATRHPSTTGNPRNWTLDRKATCHPDRKHYCKGLCKHCYRNTPEWKEKRRKYARKPEVAEQRRIRNRKRIADGEWLEVRYGVSLEDYYQLLDIQDGVCAICKRKDSGRDRDKNGRLLVDHNHETDQVRGLLCHKCNLGLGYFNDNPELLIAAINYLRQQVKTC